jgi:hypothetical protein
MNRPEPLQNRTPAQAADIRDLGSAISRALASSPIDISSLRRGVWTYVAEERRVGTSPGRVILALTDLIDASPRMSAMQRGAATRRVILWSVEAYFGQLGGEVAPMVADHDAVAISL